MEIYHNYGDVVSGVVVSYLRERRGPHVAVVVSDGIASFKTWIPVGSILSPVGRKIVTGPHGIEYAVVQSKVMRGKFGESL
jgi:hypothetical protein